MKRFTVILIAALALMLTIAGCSPYKLGRHEAQLELPTIKGASEANPALYGDTDRWWSAFEDPKLNALIQDAFNNNLDLIQAHERLLQAKSAAREAGAPRWPAIGVGVSGGKAKQPTAMGNIESDTYRMSATLQYELDIWAKAGNRAKAAALKGQAAEDALRGMYMGVSAEVAELYYSTVQLKEQLALTVLTIDSLDKIKRSVELRYSKGIVTALDVYQARQNLASASTGRPSMEAAIASIEAGLALAIGKGPQVETIQTPDNLPSPPEFPAAIPSDLLMRRPDVMAALRALRAEDHLAAAAVADRFPSFSLSASYGGASDELSKVLKSPNIIWNALVNLTMPIIDGGRRKAASERQKAASREALAAYNKSVLTALKDVHVALINNNKTGETIRLHAAAVKAGENTLRVAKSQYMQGVTDYLNVLSAQQQLYQARLSLLGSRRQLISDRIQLARALGGNWMTEEIINITTDNKKSKNIRQVNNEQ